MYTKSWEIEGLEEQITELENKQEEVLAELDYILELIDPTGVVEEEYYKENINDAITAIKSLIKELK
jgi:hypothetical protein